MEDGFVGRRAKLARSGDVMARVRRGQPWLLTVESEPGLGKSALARQCVASFPGPTVLWARADQSLRQWQRAHHEPGMGTDVRYS